MFEKKKKNKKLTRIDLNIVTLALFTIEKIPVRRGYPVALSVKEKIRGNLFDHKQTLGYTGHWAVLSERRSNTVNTCARVRVHVHVRVFGEVSQVRACKRTLHRVSSSSSNIITTTTTSSSLCGAHAAISRAATSRWTACVLSHFHTRVHTRRRRGKHARERVQRLTGARYLGSVAPCGGSKAASAWCIFSRAIAYRLWKMRRVRFDTFGNHAAVCVVMTPRATSANYRVHALERMTQVCMRECVDASDHTRGSRYMREEVE